MNGKVNVEDMKDKALEVCGEFLGGPWRKISREDLIFHEISGGLSNTLYRCALPETIEKDSQSPKEVLLRIYGPIQDDPNVIVTEAVTFMLLSERKLGPKLYGIFPKGRLEEFIPSHSLNSDELRSYSLLIAREMAKIHALDVPVKKTPDLFQFNSQKWLAEVEDILQKDSKEYFMSLEEYRREIGWLTKEMDQTNSPIVFCHNDLQGGNVLYREDSTLNGKPNLILIDFEFGNYNYRGFDLANHFSEWCFDYCLPEYPHYKMDLNKFPSKQEQIEFFTAYLDELSKEGVLPKRPIEEELDLMLKEIPLFASACHLLWSLWSAKMTLTSSFGFAHREHGRTRGRLYQIFKEQYLTL